MLLTLPAVLLHNGHDESSHGKSNRKKKGHRLLHRLAPGKSNSLGGVRDRNDNVATSPPHMAKILGNHWSEVFQTRGINQERLNAWLEEDKNVRRDEGPSHAAIRNIKLRRRDVKKAIKLSNNSAPGPDGIPYGAWRALGKRGIDLLLDAFMVPNS